MCRMEGPLVSPLLVQPQGEPNSLLAGPAVPWGRGSLSPQQPCQEDVLVLPIT